MQSLTFILVFPEMRTALRTYHPVPSLQKTDGNLQDAPRIKNILNMSPQPDYIMVITWVRCPRFYVDSTLT